MSLELCLAILASIALIVGAFVLDIKLIPKLLKFKRLIDFSRTIPGPSFREVITNAKKKRILLWLKEQKGQYGSIFKVWLGTDLLLFISDPDDVKKVLNSNILSHKSTTYDLLRPWLGNGLLTRNGEEWQKRRKMITPAFHFKVLSTFQGSIEECCKILINKLNNVADGETTIDIYPYITLFSLDIICDTAMGIKKNAQIKNDSKYVKAVQKICHILEERIFNIWHRFSFTFQFTKAAKEYQQVLNIIHSETRGVIEDRRNLLEQEMYINLNEIEKCNTFSEKNRLAFLDMLLLSQKHGVPISDKEICEEVNTFMFAGHDTTSSALSFILYLLSKHPEVQQKTFEEITKCEDYSKNIKYLEAVIKESLRLFPPVPSFSRTVSEGFNLNDNLRIPEGATIAILAYMVNRDPKYYSNPEKFIPERFIDSTKDAQPYSFISFSAGPRNCIGQKFAMLELKCSVANLLRNFEILPADNFEVEPFHQLVLKSANGVCLKLKKRI